MKSETRARRESRAPSVWRSLADPTRREILDRLREAPRTTGELAALFPTSRFSVMKHLTLLEAAGLVVVRREGRRRWNHLNAVPLQEMVERWVRPYEAQWASTLLALRDSLGGPMSEELTVRKLELEISINAPAERVWKALVEEPTRWWRADFYTAPEPRRFTIEPWAGGRMFESGAGGVEVLWGNIASIVPGRRLDVVGHLTPSYGGPATTMFRIALQETEGRTILRLSDCVHGRVDDKLVNALDEGWRALLGETLKNYVESGADTSV